MRLSRKIIDSSVLASVILMGANATFASSTWDDNIGLGLIFEVPDLVQSTRNLRKSATLGHRQLGTLKVGDNNVSGCSAQYATITEALDNANPGDTIELCAGTFEEAILIPSTLNSLKITGQGKGLSVIRSPAGSTVVLSTGPGITIEVKKLTLDGNNVMSSQAQAVAGIVCFKCNAVVNEVEIINIRSSNPAFPPGIEIFARSNPPNAGNTITIKKSDVLGAGFLGVLIDGAGFSGTVKDNNVVGDNSLPNQSIGIQVSGKANVDLENNSVSNFKSANLAHPATGINVFCAGGGTKVKGNTIEENDLGITLIDTSTVTVESNAISNTAVGISIEFQPSLSCPTPIAVENNVVFKNAVLSSQAYGIRLASAVGPGDTTMLYNLMNDNVIKDTNGSGILVETGDGNTFTNNIIEQSTFYGIGVSGGAGSLFKENEITHNGVYGIAFAGGEGNTIERNKVSQSSDSGIGIEGGMENEFKINEIEESDKNGIYVVDGDNIRVTENKIANSGLYQVHVVGGSSNVFEKNEGVVFIDV